LGSRLLAFGQEYASFFRTQTRNASLQAQRYLQGLLQGSRRNVERMSEVVPDSDAQALHHFLTHSPWDARAVMDRVACDLDELIGGSTDTCLLLDETCFAKKGKKSAGVARQWCGRQGKTDNCQVAVFAALVRGKAVGLIDAELYLPKEWISDPTRCDEAGVPASRRQLKTKPQLALEMVQRARRNGLSFSYVAADGTYGQDRALLRALDEAGERFVVDVHRDQRIFPAPSDLRSAQSDGNDTAEPSLSREVRVDAWAEAQPQDAWEEIWVRHATQGALKVEAMTCRVWLQERTQPVPRCWHLVVSREIGAPSTIKYSLCNATEPISLRKLVYLQRQRYWIERAFQEAKNEAGLDEYQARSWQAWYHHVALVMMAMLFLLREKQLHEAELPLLSTADVKYVLARILPRRDLDPEELMRQLNRRHQQRKAAIDSAYRRQGKASQEPTDSSGDLTK